jgi:hypothetical protein
MITDEWLGLSLILIFGFGFDFENIKNATCCPGHVLPAICNNQLRIRNSISYAYRCHVDGRTPFKPVASAIDPGAMTI